MNIQISSTARNWFKQEFDVSDNPYIRFFARYGGNSTIKSGFSLGVVQENPNQVGVKVEEDSLIFYIEESDLWYFEGYDLEVIYDENIEEIQFIYKEKENQGR